MVPKQKLRRTKEEEKHGDDEGVPVERELWWRMQEEGTTLKSQLIER